MFEWNKKEAPLKALAGMGGGVGRGAISDNTYATGGIINDYEESGTYYRAHIFVSPGTFEVVNNVTSVDWLIVAGGGAGGGSTYCGGGGGAGGYRTGNASVSTQPYPIVVGKGGRGSAHENKDGCKGQNSSAFGFSSTGGGAGGPHNGPQPGDAGGSGGGGSQGSGNDGLGNQGNYTPAEGYPGAGNWYAAGGGGGGAGGPHPHSAGTPSGPYGGGSSGVRGRDGVRNTLAGPSTEPSPVGGPGPGSGPAASATGWFAGGGGGGHRSNYNVPRGDGGYGGGGQGGPESGGQGRSGVPGFITSGGGGGGTGGNTNDRGWGGDGGQGVVVVRYELPEIKTRAATGGNISFYGGKTIHTFVTNGTFTAPSSFNKSIEYVVIGGGGGGGGDRAGGGGAGALVTGTRTCSGPFAATVNIGPGGQGGYVISGSGVAGESGGTTSINIPGGTVSAPGGGGGGGSATNNSNGNGQPGASGGGTSRCNPVNNALSPEPTRGLATHPSGNPGGLAFNGNDPYDGGGGGGGTGGAGGNAPTGGVGGDGGEGTQLPITFQDPNSGVGFPGPAGGFYVAGGGGGGAWGPGPGPGGNGKAGGGHGGLTDSPQHSSGHSAYDSSGSGGGGCGGYPADRSRGGMGGSGMILIAYPT